MPGEQNKGVPFAIERLTDLPVLGCNQNLMPIPCVPYQITLTAFHPLRREVRGDLVSELHSRQFAIA